MKPIQFEEIQPLLLSMLKAFIQYSQEHGIQYFAAGGTLLGAVRHQGFIPWDDDIDLFITEEMAQRLLDLVKENPFIDKERRYRLLIPATAPNVYPIIKLIDTKTVVYEQNISKKYACGLWIDIFKMAYWPNDMQQSEKLFAEQNRIKKFLQLSIFGNLKDMKYKLIAPFALVAKSAMLAVGKNCNYWSGKLFRLGSQEKTGYVGNLSWSSSLKDRYPAEWYRDAIELPFEDAVIFAPAEYEKILKQFYGDYMQIPPENKRIRHDFEAYFID